MYSSDQRMNLWKSRRSLAVGGGDCGKDDLVEIHNSDHALGMYPSKISHMDDGYFVSRQNENFCSSV